MTYDLTLGYTNIDKHISGNKIYSPCPCTDLTGVDSNDWTTLFNGQLDDANLLEQGEKVAPTMNGGLVQPGGMGMVGTFQAQQQQRQQQQQQQQQPTVDRWLVEETQRLERQQRLQQQKLLELQQVIII